MQRGCHLARESENNSLLLLATKNSSRSKSSTAGLHGLHLCDGCGAFGRLGSVTWKRNCRAWQQHVNNISFWHSHSTRSGEVSGSDKQLSAGQHVLESLHAGKHGSCHNNPKQHLLLPFCSTVQQMFKAEARALPKNRKARPQGESRETAPPLKPH